MSFRHEIHAFHLFFYFLKIPNPYLHQNSEHFFDEKKNERVVLMTTKASVAYTDFKFDKNDTLLFGRESSGVPDFVHKKVSNRLKIPMAQNKRSLNLATSVAIILAENIRQINLS